MSSIARTARHELAIAAADLVGTPFRLHGRDPKLGLDCIGLVAASLTAIGTRCNPPRGYRLRNTCIFHWLDCAIQSGLVETEEPIASGDVILVQPGPGQHHLLICETIRSFLHAHAGLGKVVRTHGPLAWPAGKIWRLNKSS